MTRDKTTAADGEGHPLFAAVIRPHRSLGRTGFRITMLVFAAAAALIAIRFVLLGFWPVMGFLGLDVLGLYIAFRVSYGRARGFEEIILTRLELLFRSVTHKGAKREWRLNPLWTRLVRERHAEFGLQRIALESGRHRIVIARDLSPDEREHFADEFGAALSRAKRGY